MPRFPVRRELRPRLFRTFVRACAGASLPSSFSLRVLVVSSQTGDWVLPKQFLSLVAPDAAARDSLWKKAERDRVLIARKSIRLGRLKLIGCVLRVPSTTPTTGGVVAANGPI